MKATVHLGDSRQPTAHGIAEGSVDCIVTSPPYWNLKRYGDEVDGEIGHGQQLGDYMADMRQIFTECHRVGTEDAVMWVIVDTMRYPTRSEREYEVLPLPTDLAEVAQRTGWRFQDTVIWRKNKTLPFSGTGKLRNLIEYVLLFTKTRNFKHRPHRLAERHQPDAEWLAGWPERYHPLGRNPSNIWDISIPTQGMWAHTERLHFCPLPGELVRRCIELTTDPGDTVFDPFAGIGTVPAQAEALGRVGLGIELNPAFIEIFKTKTRPEMLASWEAGSRRRQLSKSDQAAEAALVLRLRALKAGKELSKYLERLAQSRPASHPAAKVQSVVVRPLVEAETCIEVVSGRCDPYPVEMLVLATAEADRQRDELADAVASGLQSDALRSISIDMSFRLASSSVVGKDACLNDEVSGDDVPLYQFDLGRHGAFTERPMEALFSSPPRLLTTIHLEAPLHPGTPTPLEQARDAGEKKLLQSMLSSGMSLDAMAGQLRMPLVKLDELLQQHGLAAETQAFSVQLPEALSLRAENLLR